MSVGAHSSSWALSGVTQWVASWSVRGEAFGCQVGLGGAAKSSQLDGGELVLVHGGVTFSPMVASIPSSSRSSRARACSGVFLSSWSSPWVEFSGATAVLDSV